MKMKTIAPSTAVTTLRQAGIAQTPQRLAVLSLLQKAKSPLSADNIHQQISKRTCIDRVTVYRALSLFRKRGILRDVMSEGGALYVELSTSERPKHPHLRCRHCGVLACMPPVSSDRLGELIDCAAGYLVDEADIHLKGLCASCGRINATGALKETNP
jgi:Fur family ferric uptake transcriptional regulator